MTVEENITVKFKATCDFCERVIGSYRSRHEALRRLESHIRSECQAADHSCGTCGSTWRACSLRIVRGRTACCHECFETDTHNVTFEASVAYLEELREELDTKES